MHWNQIYLVLKREYLTRVKSKVFIISTLLIPLGFVAYIALIIGIQFWESEPRQDIAIHDQTSVLVDRLIEQNEEIVSQKEEIQQQSNWISEHNAKLEEQAKTIALQNKELKIINQMLDFKVEQRTKELEKANHELSEFLYRSSHDIVGPIATLSGLVNVAKKDLHDQLTQTYLLRMDNTIDQLNSVIRSINVVYEIRNRELDYRKERIEDLVRTTIKSQEHIALKNGVKISYEIEDGLEEASIDDFLVRIALAELIKNACSFHSHDTGEKPFRAKVSVGYHKKNKIKFTIEDNGMGIDPGYEHLIFQMFKKATVNSGGAGLGLYVAMLAAERIKGKIKYSPNDNCGAKFEMIFPLFDKIQLKSFSLN
jgi:signal transduction histidine kinase